MSSQSYFESDMKTEKVQFHFESNFDLFSAPYTGPRKHSSRLQIHAVELTIVKLCIIRYLTMSDPVPDAELKAGHAPAGIKLIIRNCSISLYLELAPK